jgi:hypothetical protein
MLSGTGVNITVKGIDNLGNEFLVETDSYTPGVISKKTLDDPVLLPLYSPEVDYLEYFIYSDANVQGDDVYELNLDCGCGNPYSYGNGFGWNKPNFGGRLGWANWLSVAGIEVNSVANFATDPEYWESLSKYSYSFGLNLDADIFCDINKTFCNGDIDFRVNELGLATAYAIYYKTAYLTMETFLGSGVLNKIQLFDHENTLASMEFWEVKYQEHLDYLVQNIHKKPNECFECLDRYNIKKVGILS